MDERTPTRRSWSSTAGTRASAAAERSGEAAARPSRGATDAHAATGGHAVTDESFVAAVQSHVRARDVLALAAVPVALVAVSLLPISVRRGLTFAYADPTLLSAYASHFVHLSPDHLLANLLAYGLIAPVAYLLCVLCGRRGLFYAALATFLTAFPLALSALNLAFVRPRAGYGFSGVNAALFGLLCFALADYAGEQLAASVDERQSPPLFFGAVSLVAILAVPVTFQSVGVAVAALLCGLLYSEAALGRLGLPSLDAVRRAAGRPGYFELAGAGLGVVLAYPFIAFPPTPVADGGVLNLYTHLLGFCLGYISIYVTVLVSAWG